MHKKLLQYQRKTNAVFFPLSLASFTGMKGKRVSPGNGASPYWCYCSEVEKRLAICCWCCDPCFTWLAFKSPLPSDDGWLCWHQVAPIGGKTDSYHDNLWMETTWLAEQSSFCQAGGCFLFFFFLQPLSIFNLDACVNKSELYVSLWAVRKSSPSSASFFFSHLFSGIMRRDKWLPLAKGQTPACKTANN